MFKRTTVATGASISLVIEKSVWKFTYRIPELDILVLELCCVPSDGRALQVFMTSSRGQ